MTDTATLANKTPAELIAIITALTAANRSKLTLKVSDKGGLSLYGLGRWPVTLYRSQWERLLDEADTIRAFIASHAAVLIDKPRAD